MRLYHPNSGFIESDRSTNISALLSNGWVEVVTEKIPDYQQENVVEKAIDITRHTKRGYK